MYLNAAKIAKARELYSPLTLQNIPPIEVKEFKNDLIIVDGHTRAYIAFKLGFNQINVFISTNNSENDEYFSKCVILCKAEKIFSIADLSHRILPNSDYKRLWLSRIKHIK
ncbi:MAG: hypothetical protein ACFFD1_09850 [Candidatus Thorarchaeota archaeon]